MFSQLRYICLLSVLVFFISGCSSGKVEKKGDFPSGSIINSSQKVSVTNEQIQKINELLLIKGLNNPDNGYRGNIQSIAPNDDLVEFDVKDSPENGEPDYSGKYGLSVYQAETDYYVFVYSLFSDDDNAFVDENRCLGYLYFDTVIEADVLTNADTIEEIRKHDSNFNVDNRTKYADSAELTLRRMGELDLMEPPKSIPALFVTNKGLYVVTYEVDETDSQMVRVPKENAKILNVQKIENPVFTEVYKRIVPE